MKKLFTQMVRPAYGTALAVALTALTVGGCVDDNYDLDNLDKEVTIGDDIVLPLGTLSQKTLSDMLDDESLGNLKPDSETGIYTYSFQSEEHRLEINTFVSPITVKTQKMEPVQFAIPTLPSEFELERTAKQTQIEYPDFEYPSFGNIALTTPVQSNDLPAAGQTPVGGTFKASNYGQVTAEFSLDQDMPEMVGSFTTIYLGDNGNSSKGAALTAKIALNGLSEVNTGGSVNISLAFPATYTIASDERGAQIDGSTFKHTKTFAAGDTEVAFVVYLKSIDTSGIDIHKQYKLIEDIDYEFDLEMNFKAGTVGSTAPHFSVAAAPVCIDADVVTAASTTEIEPDTTGSNEIDLTHTFDNLQGVKSVNSIPFKSGAAINLSVESSNIPAKMAEYIVAEIGLPEYYKFRNDSHLDASNTLKASLSDLNKGISLGLESIDCSNATIANGSMTLEGKAVSTVKLNVPAGTKLKLSEMKAAGNTVNINTVIEPQSLAFDLANCDIEFDSFVADEVSTAIQFADVEIPTDLAIDKISAVNISDGNGGNVTATLTLSLGNAAIPTSALDLNYSLNVGKMLHPADSFTTDAEGNRIISGTAHWDLNSQKELKIAIDIDGIENIEVANGILSIDEQITVSSSATPVGGLNDNWDENIEFAAAIDVDQIYIDSFVGTFGYEKSLQTDIDMSSLADFGLDLTQLEISPIIEISITNPIGAKILAGVELTPFDEEGNQMQGKIVIAKEQIQIEGNATSQFVISTPARRNEFPGKNFIEAKLTDLFKGGTPSVVTLKATIATSDEQSTIVLSKNEEDVQEIKYDYAVTIPLEFEPGAKTSYTFTIEDFAEGLDESLNGIYIKNVAVAGQITSTLPLDLILSAKAIDADGVEIPANDVSLTFPENENIIHGTDDESKPATSQISIQLNLPNGRLEELTKIDHLEVSLSIANSSPDKLASLKSDQWISAIFTLRIKGGITIDFDQIDFE